jgi:hypothetical protein
MGKNQKAEGRGQRAEGRGQLTTILYPLSADILRFFKQLWGKIKRQRAEGN